MLPELTLLIPCYNEELILKRKIKNCLELSYPKIREIVIIDDFSTDKTSQIAKTLARKKSKITFLSNQFKKGKAGALLTGVKHAATDLICISDADVLLEKESLEKMIPFFKDSKVGMVGGALKPVVFNPSTGQYTDIRGFWDKIYFQIQKTLSQVDSIFFQHGQFFTLRKSLHVYPRSGIQIDDTDISARIRLKGFRSILAPQSFFWEEIAIAKNDFDIRFRRTQGVIKALWQYRNLFFNPKFGKYGLICYPVSFFLYLFQPFLLFSLTFFLFAISPLLIKLFLFLIIFFVPPIKKFFYMDTVLILSIIKVLFFKKDITDSWDTQRKPAKSPLGWPTCWRSRSAVSSQRLKRFLRSREVFFVVLLVLAFFYRVYGLEANHSFWTDENHVAIFARAILERGKPVLANDYSTGVYQWLQYWLSAVSAKIFGLNEFAIRFPSVIFGVLTIWAVYLLGKELFSKNVGLVAALFTTFLKIEILWSRQARPYQALQFFFLLSAYFVYKLVGDKKFNWPYFLGFLGCGFLASLMHGLGLIIFFVGFLYLLIFRFSWFKEKWIVLGLIAFLLFGYVFRLQIFGKISQIGEFNKLFYYRVLLWHNYSLLVFLALVGFLSCIFKKRNSWQILVLFLAVQTMVAAFFLGQPFVRYFYIVFPFLILLSAAGLVKISQTFKIKHLALIILTLFIIGMGHKFTLEPRRIYSLNEDMQELPEVDWKKVYGFVDQELSQDKDLVLITNWNDLPIWFLGEGNLDYLIRKIGQKKVKKDPVSSAVFLYSLEEFENVIGGKKKGILVIDSWDDRVPDGIREYCRDNLKKELEVDRIYPVQPRYWPVEVYSWGI